MGKVVEVDGVGKRFLRRNPDRSATLREFVTRGFRMHDRSEPVWALRHLTFDVAAGEMLGVVGRNGCGKSTLLRVLGNVLEPDEGSVRRHCRANGLLELNTGMHPEFSGRENAILASVLSGCLRHEAEERLDSIIAFSELAEVIDQPFRTYSSGMKLRLGFAVAAHVSPEFLLIDEVLAVGDLAFQQKCLDRIRRFKEEGTAVVIVSHDLEQLTALCDRAIWLNGGTIAARGGAAETIAAYRDSVHAETDRLTPPELAEARNGPTVRKGSQEVRIVRTELLDRSGVPVAHIRTGAGVTVRVQTETPDAGKTYIVDVSLYTARDELVVDCSTEADGVALPSGDLVVDLAFERLDLIPGDYFLSVGVFEPNWEHAYDFQHHVAPLRVTGGPKRAGQLAPPRKWACHRTQ